MRQILFSALVTIVVAGCSPSSPHNQQNEILSMANDFTAAIALESLTPKDVATRLEWSPAKYDRHIAAQVRGMHGAMKREFELKSMDANGAIGDQFTAIAQLFIDLVETGDSSAAVGAIPSAPATGGGGAIPRSPGSSANAPIPKAPGTGGAVFSPLPSLFTIYGSSGSAGDGDFASAFCNLLDGVVNYTDRCGYNEAGIYDMFTYDQCMRSIGKQMTAITQANGIPAGLVNILDCLGEAFKAVPCGESGNFLGSQFSTCGLRLPAD